MLHASYAQSDITPPHPIDLCGFVARTQPATRSAAPILARLILLQRGRTRAVIAACDLLGFTVQDSRQLEAAIARAANTSPKSVFLSCTHQHSGPMSMPLGAVGTFDRSYLRLVQRGLVDAARRAASSLAPVSRIIHGRTPITDLAEYRCVKDKHNRHHWPGELQAVLIERGNASPIAVAHAGIHPYLLGWKSRLMHPDFPGPACNHIARAIRGHALFLAGCGADVAPRPAMTTSLKAVDAYARQIAAAFTRAIATKRDRYVFYPPLSSPNSRPDKRDRYVFCAPPALSSPSAAGGDAGPARLHTTLTTPRIAFGFVPPITIPDENEPAIRAMAAAGKRIVDNYRQWKKLYDAGKLPAAAPFPIHLLQLGELLFIGMPAELFNDTGRDLIKALPNYRVLPCAHVGGNLGYLPRPFAYKHKTYEAASAFHWYRTPGSMARNTDALVRRAARRALSTQPI